MKASELTSVSGEIVAKVLGIPRRTHSSLVRRKLLPASNLKREYDLPESVRAYFEYKLNADAPQSAAEEKRRLLKEQADNMALKNEQKRGELVLTDQINQLLMAWTTVVVAEFESVPGRCVPVLEGVTDPGEKREKILDVCRGARSHIADWLRSLSEDFEKYQDLVDRSGAAQIAKPAQS